MEKPTEPDDVVKLRDDVTAVFYTKTKLATDFPEPYRSRILTAYRFSGTTFRTHGGWVATLTRDTLDMI